MKTLTSLLIITSLTTGFALAQTIKFDDAAPGKPPAGWTATQTGTGQAKWTIEKDDTAPSKPNVLKQAGEATFAIALKEGTSLNDGMVEVKFKTLSGAQDQVGGVIWRAKDTNNYYLCRAQALRGNISFYKAVNGKRVTLKQADGKAAATFKVPMAKAEWHTLRVQFQGNKFKATLDG